MTNEKAIKIIECGDISNRWGKEGREVEDMAIEALERCSKIDKIIDSYDADFIANYVRGLFAE